VIDLTNVYAVMASDNWAAFGQKQSLV